MHDYACIMMYAFIYACIYVCACCESHSSDIPEVSKVTCTLSGHCGNCFQSNIAFNVIDDDRSGPNQERTVSATVDLVRLVKQHLHQLELTKVEAQDKLKVVVLQRKWA